MDEFIKRRTPRYQSFNYDSIGVYFLTICTQNRRCILSRVVGTGVLDRPQTKLTGCDKIVGTGVLDCPQTELTGYDKIVGTGVLDCPQTELTGYGKIADKYIKQLSEFYHHLSVEKFVIMPNHIHLLLWVKAGKDTTDNGQSRTPVPTNIERANSACSQFVSTFKRFCNKEYGKNIWQARFHDHIIRNRETMKNT